MSFSSTDTQQSFGLLSSTRYDLLLLGLRWNNDRDGNPSPFLLLSYHLDRLIDAAEQHAWAQAKASLSWDTLKSACQHAVDDYHTPGDAPKALKIRLVLSESGVLSATASPANPLNSDPTSPSFFNPNTDTSSLFGPVFTIHVDTQPTPSSLFTSTKTTYRMAYDEARSRNGIPPLTPAANPVASDVLLYNSQNLITETSISNVAFYHSPHWITPAVSTGCLPGVLRRWLLEQGRIREDKGESLTKDSIREGDWVLLLNGVQGCRLGRIASV